MSNFELHFELEPSCILACRHCSSYGIRNASMGYGVQEVLRLVKAVDPLEIYFTGGEPLLFQDLLPLFTEISAQSPACRLGLFTTGIISSGGCVHPVDTEYLSQLYHAGLRVCYVSLYSDEENWHDYMTGTSGSFARTVQAIRNMTAVGIDARINLVVTRFNASRIRHMIDFVSGLRVSEVRLLKLINHGNATKHWDVIGLTDQEYLQTVTAVHSQREELAVRVTFSSLPRLSPCRPIAGSCGCQARKNLLYVTLAGDIYPCACVKNSAAYSICNLKDPALEQLVKADADQKQHYTSCLAESDHLARDFDKRLSDCVSQHFSELDCTGEPESAASAVSAFLDGMKAFVSGTKFFELLVQKNRSGCMYYEVHSFFLAEDAEKGGAVCLIAPDVDISQVRGICEKKFPDLPIRYQAADSAFAEQYIKEELLKQLAVLSDSRTFRPEGCAFLKECMDLLV